jgi:O-antigen ligase
MFMATIILVIYENPSVFFVVVFFINHIMFVDGGHYSNFLLVGTILILSPVFFYLKKPKRLMPLFLPASLVLLYYLLVLFLKPYTLNGIWVMVHFEAMAVFILTQFLSWNTEKIANVSKLHMIALVIFGIFEVTLSYTSRIRGPMFSSTVYGVLLVIVWSIWLSYELLKANPQYKSAFIYTIFAIAIMIATGTRMTAIGVAATFALILLTRSFAVNKGHIYKKILKFGLSGVAAALIIIAIWTLLPQDLHIKKGFQSIIEGQVDDSNMGRLFAWYCGIQAFKESPLLGIGNGNFMQFIQQHYGAFPIPTWYRTIPHAHNATLVILSENGIFGIMTVLILVCMALLQVFRHIKQSNFANSGYCLIIGFAVMYLLSMFDAVPYYPSCMVWGAWFLGALMQLPVERKENTILVKPSISGA